MPVLVASRRAVDTRSRPIIHDPRSYHQPLAPAVKGARMLPRPRRILPSGEGIPFRLWQMHPLPTTSRIDILGRDSSIGRVGVTPDADPLLLRPVLTENQEIVLAIDNLEYR